MLSKNQQKFISSLALKKFREETRQFIVEGNKLTDELLGSEFGIAEIFATRSWIDAAREKKAAVKRVKITEIDEAELKKISQLSTPNEVLAVAQMPATSQPDFSSGYFLALDRVNDPGNLGTIIRIADWFGVKGIICSPGTVDCFNPKTVQSSMGSVFRVGMFYNDLLGTIREFERLKKPVYAAVLDGEPLRSVRFDGSGLIVMGSESHGIQKELLPFVTHKITIEKKGEAESLNVAVATGIICSRL